MSPFPLSSRLPPPCPGSPWGVPWEQPTCLWQVEKEMTLENRHGFEARRAARQTSAQPGRAGDPSRDDLSAVGAALDLHPLAPVSLGAYPAFLTHSSHQRHLCGSP